MLKRSAIVVMNTLLALFTCANAPAATIATHKTHTKTHHITESTAAQKKMARMRSSSKTVASRNRSTHTVASVHVVSKKHHYYERFAASSFADNQVDGDITAGEDPIVRAAADLLASSDVALVRACSSPTCQWLFLDTSKNHHRRWCSMKQCGNRAKVRRFYAKKKTSA